MTTHRHPTSRHSFRYLFLALAVASLLSFCMASSASAGQLNLWACHQPDGQAVAPMDGWALIITAPFIEAPVGCSPGGAGGFGLHIEINSHPGHTYAAWKFTAPLNTTVTSYMHERKWDVWGYSSYQTFRGTAVIPDGAHLAERCQPSAGCNIVPQQQSSFGLNKEAGVLLQLEACSLVGGCDGFSTAWFEATRARITLQDDYVPTISAVSGGLASGATLTGDASLNFQAADLGTGIYKLHAKVDGVSWDDRVLDSNNGKCQTVGDGRDFLYGVPCKLTLGATTTLPTASLADGTHTIDVAIEDATGNTSTVLHDQITTSNAPSLLVSPSVLGVPQVGRALSVGTGGWTHAPTAFGYQWSMDGQPIAGATSATFVPTEEQAYKRVSVRITASNGSGSASASVLSDLLLDEDGNTAPAGPPNVGLPTVGGTLRVGMRPAPTVNVGVWTGATSYDVRWRLCPANATSSQQCTDTGETGSTYTLTRADQYRRLVARVTAHNHRSTTTVDSAPSAVIGDIDGGTAPAAGDTSAPDPTPKPSGPPTVSPSTGGDGGGGGSTSTGSSVVWPNGVDGLLNPLAGAGSHAANGTGATATARYAKVNIKFGRRLVASVRSPAKRRWVIVGRLATSSGRGIGGALLVCVTKAPGGGWKAGKSVRTRRDGSFDYPLRPQESQSVRFAYFPFSDTGTATMSRAVSVGVFAPSRISVETRTVDAGSAVVVRGTIHGASRVNRGLLVQVQLYQSGFSWRPVGQARTDAQGRWTLRYVTRPGLPPHRVKFRSVVAQQSTWPYLTTVSRPLEVSIR